MTTVRSQDYSRKPEIIYSIQTPLTVFATINLHANRNYYGTSNVLQGARESINFLYHTQLCVVWLSLF